MNKRTFIKNTIISLFAGSALARRIQAKEPNIDYEAWFKRIPVLKKDSSIARKLLNHTDNAGFIGEWGGFAPEVYKDFYELASKYRMHDKHTILFLVALENDQLIKVIDGKQFYSFLFVADERL